MYGSWLPSVSTPQKYGFRSSVQSGVLIGVTVFQADRTGSSGLSAQLYLALSCATQLSNPPAFAFASTCPSAMYFGRNCLT